MKALAKMLWKQVCSDLMSSCYFCTQKEEKKSLHSLTLVLLLMPTRASTVTVFSVFQISVLVRFGFQNQKVIFPRNFPKFTFRVTHWLTNAELIGIRALLKGHLTHLLAGIRIIHEVRFEEINVSSTRATADDLFGSSHTVWLITC